MKTNHELFALAESLLAQEDDGRFEDETHGVQLQSLFDFAQKIGNVEPLDSAVVQKLRRTQIDRLFARLLVLTEEVVKDGAVLFVDALHLVDVLGHFFHAFQCVCKVEDVLKALLFLVFIPRSLYYRRGAGARCCWSRSSCATAATEAGT